MAAYTIENDVPIPEVWRGKGFSSTVRLLEVGQSIFVRNIFRASAMTVCNLETKLTGKKFKVGQRQLIEGGFRVWRIA